MDKKFGIPTSYRLFAWILAFIIGTASAGCVINTGIPGAIAENAIENTEEELPYIFDKEYLQELFDAFVKEGRSEEGKDDEGRSIIGDLGSRYKYNPDATYDFIIILNDVEGWVLKICANTDVNDPSAIITQAELYDFDYEAGEYFGFIQRYYDQNGKKDPPQNIMFYGPIGSDILSGFDNLDDEDFRKGVQIFLESPRGERRAPHDAYGESLDEKYAAQ